MARILITAKKSDLPGQRPPAFIDFDDGAGNKVVVHPIDGDDGVFCWFVADTDRNRDLYNKNIKPSGIFSAKVIDAKSPEPVEGDGGADALVRAEEAEAEAETQKVRADEAEKKLRDALAEIDAIRQEKKTKK